MIKEEFPAILPTSYYTLAIPPWISTSTLKNEKYSYFITNKK